MRREAWTLAIVAGFSLSLAATSKAPVPPSDAGSLPSSTVSATVAPRPSAGLVRANLPDTSSWKPFTFPAGKLKARTPPGAKIVCTQTKDISVCIVMRGKKQIATFSPGGRSVADMADDMRDPTEGKHTVLHDEPGAFALHRDDPVYGSFCEFAVDSPAKLRSVFSLVDRKQDVAVFKMVALQDSECLEAIAFAKTLESAE